MPRRVQFGLEPVEIRRRNLIEKFPYTSATGLVFDEGSYRQTLDMASEALDVPAFRQRQRQARAERRYLGIGFATFSERTGYGTPAFAARGMGVTPGWETVELTMDPSGVSGTADRREPARPRAAHDARPTGRRRAWRLLPTASRSCTATPTARPMAGAPSPAARWSSPAAPAFWRRARCMRS